MTGALQKAALQQRHIPALQTSAPQSVRAHTRDPPADLSRHTSSCRQDLLTSEAAEPSFFVVLADVGLIVPSHRGPQVLRSTDGSFPERVGGEAQTGCGGEGPWGATFKPKTGALGLVPALLCGPSPLRLTPTYLTIPEEAFPIDVSLGFTYFW